MQKNKIAIVTGGASGIGFAISKKFIENGIRVIVAGRDRKKLEDAKNKLGELCDSFYCDLNDLEKIPTLVNDIIGLYGQIDILVNNAGINMKKEFTEVTDEEFQKVLLTNVTSAFVLSREVVKFMLQKRKGSIINISSMASRYGIPKIIAYSASKSAIEGMTRAMAVELSPAGIRVNCIAPGFIVTDMTEKAFNNDHERKRKAIGRTPMGYMGNPSDIADAALYLADNEAKYVTGVVLPVDGGNSIGF
ncbi:MAG: SDR family oxidoreductase [Bacteroidota bacterium]